MANRKVSKSRIDTIKLFYEKLTDEKLAELISKNEGAEISAYAVKKMRQRLGLKKKRGRK